MLDDASSTTNSRGVSMSNHPHILLNEQETHALQKLCTSIVEHKTPFMKGNKHVGYKVPVREVDRIERVLQRNGILGD